MKRNMLWSFRITWANKSHWKTSQWVLWMLRPSRKKLAIGCDSFPSKTAHTIWRLIYPGAHWLKPPIPKLIKKLSLWCKENKLGCVLLCYSWRNLFPSVGCCSPHIQWISNSPRKYYRKYPGHSSWLSLKNAGNTRACETWRSSQSSPYSCWKNGCHHGKTLIDGILQESSEWRSHFSS